MNKFIIAAVAGILLAACSGGDGSQTATGTVDIAAAMKNPGELTTSQLGSKISFVPLETNDSSLIHAQWTAAVVNNSLIVSNIGWFGNTLGDISALVFDIPTGKFLRSLGQPGSGPEDFSAGSTTVVANSDKVYFIAGNGNGWIGYSLDGKFAGRILPEIKPKETNLLICGDGDTTVCFIENNIRDSFRELVFRIYGNSGHMIDSCVVFKGQPVENPENPFDNVILFNNHLDPFPKLRQSIQEVQKSSSSYIIPRVYAYEMNNEIHFHETMCDTIFRLTPDGAEPVLTFGFGANRFPFNNLNKRLPDKNELFVTKILESPQKALFSFSEGWLGDKSHKEYIGIYDRKSGKTIVADAKNGIRDDLGGFMPFNPVTTTADGKWIGMLTMEQIDEWLDENPEVNRPDWLTNSTAEDNPVLVIISD